jgi:uncharacterized FAD-dependent dehydrogenase
MQTHLQFTLLPKQVGNEEELCRIIAQKLQCSENDFTYRIVRKSIDARSRQPRINVSIEVFVGEQPSNLYENEYHYHSVDNAIPIVIVGAGPAGLFAALRLIELGYKPIILERGKDVSARKRDIALQNRNQAFNQESNYCFGEGGAGTFSDGKLYTRSKKRGSIRRILEIFHQHGAQDTILYEAHPHIGTDRLPIVIQNIRKTIVDCGGEYIFDAKVNDFIIEKDTIKGVKTETGDIYMGDAVVLATGHSARDIYTLLHEKGISLEAKGFAMGVRVEHPQALIDQIQYHTKRRDEYLPAASYSIVNQIDGRGVYSFCMCPGGHIVPASTESGAIVVNGMSAAARNSRFANSGIVVEIRPEDLVDYHSYGELCGLEFQKQLEQTAFYNNGGGLQTAPAQRLTDFVSGKLSNTLPQCSYLPGVVSSPMHFWLPEIIGSRLRKGFRSFDRYMRGFLSSEAIVVGVESRSSSPIRISRKIDTCEHVQIKRLFPCGEGSGYAGGITSSAMDGELIAEKIVEVLKG